MRPICSFIQKWSRWEDGPETVSSLFNGHLERCPSCRSVLGRQLELTERLRHEASRSAPKPSPFLQEKIMRAVERLPRPGAEAGAETSWHWRGVWAGAASLTLLLLAGLFFLSNEPLAPDFEPGGAIVQALPPRTSASLSLTNMVVRFTEPLEAETRLVIEDARNLVAMLADSFLPERLPER